MVVSDNQIYRLTEDWDGGFVRPFCKGDHVLIGFINRTSFIKHLDDSEWTLTEFDSIKQMLEPVQPDAEMIRLMFRGVGHQRYIPPKTS